MARRVTISTISLYLPSRVVTVEENLDRAEAAAHRAAAGNPDLILLPEFYALLGTHPETYSATVAQCADRWSEMVEPFRALARAGNSYLVTTGPRRDNAEIHNTATLIGRRGEIVGHYHKTHLAPGEEGITPGNDYPVLQTDFGRIAMMICMDVHYPEVARIYALQGAEILCWPTMSWGPTDRFLTVLLAARAMDNQIYCVHSNFCGLPHLPGKPRGRACIVGPDGETRADTGHRPGIATATIDLDEGYEYWATSELKQRLPTLKEAFLGLRKPATYGVLVEQDIPWDRWQVQNPILVDPDGRGEGEDAPDYLAYV